MLIFPYHLTRVCCPEILHGSYGNHDIKPCNPGHWKWSIILAEKNLCTRSPLHMTSLREVLPTRAIRKFTNSIGKRILPNRRILSRVIIYYVCSLSIHQQVFSKHWVILQQFYGFVWVCAFLFKNNFHLAKW